jgi:MYXO-CTERM domain-containing protein
MTVSGRASMRSACVPALFFLLLLAPRQSLGQDVTTVSTFHSLSLYWDPVGGQADRMVRVSFRPEGGAWREGYPMRFNPIDGTENDLAPYRGSLVHLEPGITYEVQVELDETGETATATASTWPESFPEGEVVTVESSGETLVIEESGTADAYRVYDGVGSVIDVSDVHRNAIEIDASYVIVRNMVVRGGWDNAIRIFGGHDIVIEDLDISAWGGLDFDGDFGQNLDSAVFSNDESLARVVVQRCLMHHPNYDSNNWTEMNCNSEGNCTTHPAGPQAICLVNSAGNHVFRYNAVYSDADHYYNDIFGAGSNGSYVGFPSHDSDIYGNYLANCWDDGIESEGGNRNVRVWGNYVEHCFMAYANAATSIGPLYYWRNVSGQCWRAPDEGYGYFMKMGYAGAESWMTGHMYLFHNTILNVDDSGCGGLGGSGRIIHHAVTRNNILHVRSDASHSISTNTVNSDIDFDYDLYSAAVPDGHEANGFSGIPEYEAGRFDVDTMSGDFSLSAASLGYDSGVLLPNFNDDYRGLGPDVGAHEAGTGPFLVGPGAAAACEPMPEACGNGVDDDCDGFVDEGCGLELDVPRCSLPPVMDGDLEEYADAPSLTVEQPGLAMVARLLWDDDGLYLGCRVTDTDMRGHVEAGVEGSVWRDDAVELYLDPLDDGGPVLGSDDLQVIVSVRGALYQTFSETFVHGVAVDGTINDDLADTGFQVEIALPWSVVGVTPRAGLTMGADLAVDDRDAPDDGTPEGGEYQTADWAGLERYAVPELWGTLTLVEGPYPDDGLEGDVDAADGGLPDEPDADAGTDDGGPDAGPGEAGSGGCGCSTGGGPAGNGILVLTLLLGLLVTAMSRNRRRLPRGACRGKGKPCA